MSEPHQDAFPRPVQHDLSSEPHDINAEMITLGALMAGGAPYDETVNLVTAEAFYRPAHQLIFTVITDMHAEGKFPSAVPLGHELRRRGLSPSTGGLDYPHQLEAACPIASMGPWHAEIVATMFSLRRVLRAAQRAAQAAQGAKADPTEIVEFAMKEFQGAAVTRDTAPKALSVADRWASFRTELDQGSDPNAISTPWPDLDEVVEIKPTQLIVVGAASGGGKSLFGQNLASYVALNLNRPALFGSMEMGGSELMARLTAQVATVDLNHLIRRQLTDADRQKIARHEATLANAHNLIIDDSPGLTVAAVRSRLRWMAAAGKPAAICVLDYLQLVTPDRLERGQSRTQEVAKISRDLKLLAMEFEIPVVALAQFNRGAVGRRPTMSDFKDSSGIEQDANVVILLHNPNSDPEESRAPGPDRSGEIDVIIGKNRNGPAGRVFPLAFQGHYARLSSMVPMS